MITKKKQIQISILNQGWLRTELTALLLKILSINIIYDVYIEYPRLKPIQHNRNDIVKRFLQTNRDFLLMIDSDIVPTKNPLDLVQYNKDVIGLPCPTWKENEVTWLVMDKVEGGWQMSSKLNNKGLVEVDAVGSGAILIKRKVLENIKEPFSVLWDKDGLMDTGLDILFCEKAKKKDFSIYFHSEYTCSHFMDFDYLRLALK